MKMRFVGGGTADKDFIKDKIYKVTLDGRFVVGGKFKCVGSWLRFTVGKIYAVKADKAGIIGLIDDDGDARPGIEPYNDTGCFELLKEAKMSKYDADTVRAIEESIEHHEDNLEKLMLERGEFLLGPFEFHIGKVTIPYGRSACALCREFSGRCHKCPLSLEGDSCPVRDSSWHRITHSETRQEAIAAEENMVKVLKSLLGEEEEVKFEEGNRIEIVADGYNDEHAGSKGTVTLIDGSQTPYFIMVDGGYKTWQRPSGIKLIKEKKEMSIKDKIENINEDTTIKELDDLMEELHQARINGCGMGTINRYLLISTLNSQGEDIRIRDCNDTLLTSFHYDDQCSKLQAFKDALMWLAKKSGKSADTSIKVGNYVIALDTIYWQNYLGQYRVGNIFKVHRIDGRYFHCDEKNDDTNCIKEDIRKATEEEVEDDKNNKRKKIEQIDTEIERLGEKKRELEVGDE